MSGLVDYGSSDEDDGPSPPQESAQVKSSESDEAVLHSHISLNGHLTETKANGNPRSQTSVVDQERPMVGPSMGSSTPPEDQSMSPGEGNASTPLSPYSANRARVHQLTIPPLPNLDIPKSPPGSPSASTSTKFAHFLKLKKQGIHFNEKLANLSAMKNPSMMQKLLDFAGIDDEGQYATVLSKELWDPKGFPDWAYKEELAKNQQKIARRKEEGKSRSQRNAVDFVPATASGDSSRSVTPGTGGGGRPGPRSTAERVMAGLDRVKSASPAVQSGLKRKTRFES